MVEESEEFVDLWLWEVGVVAGVFYFKSVGVKAFACHDVWEGVEAGVADWDPDGVVSFFLQELDEYCFAVKASFAPTSKFDSVNVLAQLLPLRLLTIGLLFKIKIVAIKL